MENNEECKMKAQKDIKGFNWEFKELDGSSEMLKNLLDGSFTDDFLIVPPHHEIVETFDENKIKAVRY